MNTSSVTSSRIFTVAVSISLVLCSLSLLFFSISVTPTVKAEINSAETLSPAPWDTELRGAVGLGISKDTAYFIVFSQPNRLYKASVSKARDWYMD
jgi:hypothetical protein